MNTKMNVSLRETVELLDPFSAPCQELRGHKQPEERQSVQYFKSVTCQSSADEKPLTSKKHADSY